MFFVTLTSSFTAVSIFVSSLLMGLFVLVGLLANRMASIRLINQPFPQPISDHEQLWQSRLLYENLGSGGDQEKLVVYTMAHIKAKSMRGVILNFATEREVLARVSRIIRVTTLPSFNHQYKRELELSEKQMEKVVEDVVRQLL
jgi:hypothetical protein